MLVLIPMRCSTLHAWVRMPLCYLPRFRPSGARRAQMVQFDLEEEVVVDEAPASSPSSDQVVAHQSLDLCCLILAVLSTDCVYSTANTIHPRAKSVHTTPHQTTPHHTTLHGTSYHIAHYTAQRCTELHGIAQRTARHSTVRGRTVRRAKSWPFSTPGRQFFGSPPPVQQTFPVRTVFFWELIYSVLD